VTYKVDEDEGAPAQPGKGLGDALQVGDRVQWTSGGVDQFPEGPRPIERFGIFAGQLFVFVAGGSTGIPIDEVTKVETSRDMAILALELGLSPGVPNEDGSKSPLADVWDEQARSWTWKAYQDKPVSTEHVLSRWFRGNRCSWGLFTGFGNLEILDFDCRATFERFVEAASGVGLGDLVARVRRGYQESTPAGGVHWAYRVSEVLECRKLAKRHKRPDEWNEGDRAAVEAAEKAGRKHVPVQTLIESKGRGGFCIAAPSNGQVHPSGGAYRLDSGGLRTIATITAAERDELWRLGRSFDEMPAACKKQPPMKAPVSGSPASSGKSPGDDFEERTSWGNILEPFGWAPVHVSGDDVYWRRPGKDRGWSACTGHTKGLKVFSSSTPFGTEGTHTKLWAHVLLNHGGDWTAGIKALAQAGFGTWIDADGKERPNPPPKGWKRSRSTEAGSRPQVEVTTECHVVRDEAVKVLVDDPRVFSRGDMLAMVVRPAEYTVKLSGGVELRHAHGASRVVPIDEPNLGCLLTERALFWHWVKSKKEKCEARGIRPPSWLIKAVLARRVWPGVRELLTVAECPYVVADGRVVSKAGYDESTGTLLNPAFEVAGLPERPSQADAKEAYARILGYFHQFPFATGFDFTVWLADLLTAIQRPVIRGPVPGFAYSGNKAGCGKGLLIDARGILVWGGPVPTVAYPVDPAEADKVVLALALGGVQAVHFDNLEEGQFYGGSALDSALTTTLKGGRLLGLSRWVDGVPLRPCWCLSGNNISPGKDAFRRWLPCNLRTELERPHERPDLDVKDFRSYVAEHRAEIVRDALVILRAHAVARRPSHGWGPLGSFEEWDLAVRAPLWFATGDDCLTTQRQAADDSPKRLEKLALLEGWRSLPKGSTDGHTVQEMVELVFLKDEKGRPIDSPYPKMYSALLGIGGKNGIPSSTRVGQKLRGMRMENVGGFRFQEGAKRDNTIVWFVHKV
jgi:hypothetical protein